jgi:histidyl-tRNA synthetase
VAQDQIQSVPGTEDVLPSQWGHWRTLERAARRLFEQFGYGEVRTPILEDARLFVKGTGETTEIVEKQMYTIPAGDEESLALRPEGTPPVIRAYLERGLHRQEPFQKLYYAGAMFRRERPQRGRLRQFHQIGVEAIGSASPLMDAETILLADAVFREAGLTGFATCVNSMGCADCRPVVRDRLRALVAERRDSLCEDHRERFERNVLRVLDCKKEACREVAAGLPPLRELLCAACVEHHAEVKRALAAAGVQAEDDPRLVRGLDYYTRTVYEMKHASLGARDSICGGGRYDGLVELLGGPPTPCVGFAIGVEATLLAMEAELGAPADAAPRPQVYVVCFGDEARGAAFSLALELRRAGLAAEVDFQGRSPKAQMRAANKLGAPLCALLGPDEAARGEVTLKNMADGRQWTVPRAEAARQAAGELAKRGCEEGGR